MRVILRAAPYLFRTLATGFRLRCPACGNGRLFRGLFHMHATCAYCGARFERKPGDAVGGLYVNVALAQMTAVLGFMLLDGRVPAGWQVFIWVAYITAFSLLFYRHARGLSVAVLYLLGAVLPDPDTTREYVRPQAAPETRGGMSREREE